MTFRLSDGVRVRRESWGLLFYRAAAHKLCFVKSGDWLRPEHFDGGWSCESIADDITQRTGTPAEIIERSLSRLVDRLKKNRVISHEVR
jgi:putative mycofactocin binding protein MftB